MAKTKTANAIKADITTTGRSRVPVSVVEYLVGSALADDDDFDAAVAALIAPKDWVTGYSIDWVNRVVQFTGPWTEVDN